MTTLKFGQWTSSRKKCRYHRCRAIGLAASILFAQEGASVLMVGRNVASLEEAATRVREAAAGGGGGDNNARVEIMECDVSQESDVAAAIAAVDAWGGVDVLFNNAGSVSEDDGGVTHVTDEVWDATLATNLRGTFYGCKHAVLSFRRNGKTAASVINNASIVALVGSAVPQLAYTASKGGVLSMTRELAVVYAREGFRFNSGSLCPGPVRSRCPGDGAHAHALSRRSVHWPSGRMSECIEQAQAVVFLASDESSFITGTDFVVDGGLTKAYVTPEGPPSGAPRDV